MNSTRSNSALWFAVAAAWFAALALPASAVEWVPGAVELSTGERITGEICLAADSLYIYNEAQKKQYMISSSEMKTLETVIEKQSMEEKWFFREDGRDVKVYTGEMYPVRYYRTRITFHDGKALEGHIITKTLYVKTEGGTHRFLLRRKDEGQVGETLEDLPYVRAVLFESGEEAGVKGTIEGELKLPPGERLRKMLAINRQNSFIIEGRTAGDGRLFRFTDCTGGTYDLVVVTDKALYLCFSREREKDCCRLDQKAVGEMQQWVDLLRDFFHEQRILYAAGDQRKTFALIRKERYGGTTLEGAALVRRYDVWVMYKPKKEWQITKRLFVWRQVSEHREVPREEIVIDPSLGGHVVSKEQSELHLKLELSPTKELPIPPPAPEVTERAQKAPEETDDPAADH